MKKKLVCDTKWCKGCGICVAFCPKGVLILEDKVKIAKPEECIFCSQCEQRCPDYAIWVEEEDDE